MDKDALEVSIDCIVEHVWNAQAWLGLNNRAPQLLKHGARRVVAHMAVAR